MGQEVPALERLFLSSSDIGDPAVIAGVLTCKSLLDLALDDNPICKVRQAAAGATWAPVVPCTGPDQG